MNTQLYIGSHMEKQNNFYEITNIKTNYTKRAYQYRNQYQCLFQWARKELLKCQQQYSKVCFNDWSQQVAIVEKEQNIIQSMLFQLSERIKKECAEKGKVFHALFQYTIKTIKKLTSLFHGNLSQLSKKYLEDEAAITNRYQSTIESLKEENRKMQKQKQHKWRNLYMIIKDNRVLRRQKGKLLRKHKQQTWRSRNLEEDLVYYKKLNEKNKLLLESLSEEEENIESFIKNNIYLNTLEKKIKDYPKRAKKILKKDLIDLEIKQLNGFDSKIKSIIQALEQNQGYDDYDDWEENIEPVKLLYNISTQTTLETQQKAINTIYEPPKIYQSIKTQVKHSQLMNKFVVCQTDKIEIRELLKKKVQRKTKSSGCRNNEMSQSRFSRGSILGMKHHNSFEKKRENLFSIALTSVFQYHPKGKKKQKKEIKQPINQKQQDQTDIVTINNMHPRDKFKWRPSNKKKTNFPITQQPLPDIPHKNTKQTQLIIPPQLKLSLKSKTVSLLIQQHPLQFNATDEGNFGRQEKKIGIMQTQECSENQRMEMKKSSRENSSLLRDFQHKRQKTDVEIRQHSRKMQDSQKLQFRNSQVSLTNRQLNHEGLKLGSIKRKSETNRNLFRSTLTDINKQNIINRFSKVKTPSKQRESILKEKQAEGVLGERFIVNILEKMITNISKRKKQLLEARPTFIQYLYSYFNNLYSNEEAREINFRKFIDSLKKGNDLTNLPIPYRQCMLAFEKLLLLSKGHLEPYQRDTFALLLTVLEKAEKIGVPTNIVLYSKVPQEYGRKIIQYICSFYFSESQMHEMTMKYSILKGSEVNLWLFFYCLQKELSEILEKSQLTKFISSFLPKHTHSLDHHQISQMLSLFRNLRVKDSAYASNLTKYVNVSIPIHRIVLYAYRYDWSNMLNFISYINDLAQYLGLQFGTRSTEITNVQNLWIKYKGFPWLSEKFEEWKLQSQITNGNNQPIFLKFCKLMLMEQIASQSVDISQNLRCLEQATKTMIQKSI